MTTNICSYEGCMVRRLTCSTIAFFAIPTDSRRHQWIINSGNKDLEKLDGTRTRLFCEKHFHDSDIRSQFHRKTLRKTAIPIPYEQISSKGTRRAQRGQHTEIVEQSLGNNEIREKNIDNLVKIGTNEDLEIYANSDDLEEELAEEVLSYYEPQHDEDEELMESIVFKSEIIHDDTNFETSVNSEYAIDEESLEREARVTTTTTQDDNKMSKKLLEDVQLSTEDISTVYQKAQTSRTTYDEDKYFALSLVGYFHRLSHEKKAISKLKILSYLTALDLGKNADL